MLVSVFDLAFTLYPSSFIPHVASSPSYRSRPCLTLCCIAEHHRSHECPPFKSESIRGRDARFAPVYEDFPVCLFLLTCIGHRFSQYICSLYSTLFYMRKAR